MTESKLLEGDKDEWFYHSLERYANLYMFELEFPVDAIDVINETSICVSGVQTFSKKCEILQLAIPPKLLPKNVEEGLCKDRDFTIISGGYSPARILQIKAVSAGKDLVATTQVGVNGVTLFQLGDDDHALIKEKFTLDVPECLGSGVIDSLGNRLCATGTRGDSLYEWNMDSSATFVSKSYKIPKNQGRITKVKYWDENSVSFSTEKGALGIFDTRSAHFTTDLYAAKSQSQLSAIQYSHDTVPLKYRIGVVDSCGGYQSFDIRNLPNASESSSNRVILPGCMRSDGVLVEKFNIQYDPHIMEDDSVNFIVTGMKEDIVQVYKEQKKELLPVFTHDGHSKVVTHGLWHPTSDRLLLSCSIDAVLHAWQYNQASTEVQKFNEACDEKMTPSNFIQESKNIS